MIENCGMKKYDLEERLAEFFTSTFDIRCSVFDIQEEPQWRLIPPRRQGSAK